MRLVQLLTRLVLGLALVLTILSVWAVDTPTNKAYLVEVDGPIGPISQELIMRGIDNAEADAATMVILQMNTPGGLDHSMREIIQGILDAHVPVITFV
ncbi:MAG: nodulation protein NfeD, partial [Gammaproteobacteria bacterium]|nr:nodulation protein NfeD [Gammaproteobacteria bacterium]